MNCKKYPYQSLENLNFLKIILRIILCTDNTKKNEKNEKKKRKYDSHEAHTETKKLVPFYIIYFSKYILTLISLSLYLNLCTSQEITLMIIL